MAHAMRGLLALVVLLLAPAAASSWEQLLGNEHHNELAPMHDGRWDVEARFRAFPAGDYYHPVFGPPYAATPHGIVGASRGGDDNACALWRISDALSPTVHHVPLRACTGAMFAGYDPMGDRVLLCTSAHADRATAGLQARDPLTGALAWIATPEAAGMPPDPAGQRGCAGALIDVRGREAVLAFLQSHTGADVAMHRVVSIDLDDGGIRWSRTIPLAAVAKANALEPAYEAATDGQGADLIPLSFVKMGSGYVVTGWMVCADALLCDDDAVRQRESQATDSPLRLFVAWLDREGRVQGAHLAGHDPSEPSDPRESAPTGGSTCAGSDGTLAAQVIDHRLAIIDPKAGSISRWRDIHPLEAVPPGFSVLHCPLWTPGLFVLPIYSTVYGIDPATPDVAEPAWRWQGPAAWRVKGTYTTGDEVWFRLEEPDPDAQAAGSGNARLGMPAVQDGRLVRLSAADGSLVQVLPMHLPSTYRTEPWAVPLNNWAANVMAVPWGADRFVGVSGEGEAMVLARSQQGPRIHVSTYHPGPGDAWSIEVPRDRPWSEAWIVWGDGQADQLPFGNGTFTHVFDGPGRPTVWATLVDDEGLTQTAAVPLDVGGWPAPSDGTGIVSVEAPPYPPLNDTVEVKVTTDRPLAEVFARWGDGTSERGPAEGTQHTFRHVYNRSASYDVSIGMVYEDGSQGAVRHTVYAGMEAPVAFEPNLLQRIFARENQDMTWGVIGLVVVVLGAVLGLLTRRRRRGRMAAGMRELARIRSLGQRDGPGSLRALQSWHVAQEGRLLRGTLTEDQFRVLEQRGARLLRTLAQDVLSPILDALDPGMRRRLQAAYQDGFVDRAEVAALRHAFAGLRMAEPQRRVLETVLAAWADPGGPAPPSGLDPAGR